MTFDDKQISINCKLVLRLCFRHNLYIGISMKKSALKPNPKLNSWSKHVHHYLRTNKTNTTKSIIAKRMEMYSKIELHNRLLFFSKEITNTIFQILDKISITLKMSRKLVTSVIHFWCSSASEWVQIDKAKNWLMMEVYSSMYFFPIFW